MADDDLEPTPSSGNRGPMLAVVGLVLGLGAGFAGATFMGGDAAAEEPEPDDAEVTSQVAVLPLEPFTVNLRGGEGRLLILEVQLELAQAELEVLTERVPLVRDAIVFLASDYAAAELEGIDGKLRLRDELLGRLNVSLDGPTVKRIYFTHFLVQ